MDETGTPEWATREAKKKERPYRHSYFVQKRDHMDLLASREAYAADPVAETKDEEKRQQDHGRSIRFSIQDGRKTLARNAPDPKIRALQDVVDELSAKIPGFRSPELVISPSSPDEKIKTNAFVRVPEYIQTYQACIDHYINRPEWFRAVMAHEIGHIVNGDVNVKGQVMGGIKRKNQLTEVLADRAAAMIYGNAAQYAAHISNPDIPPEHRHIYDESYQLSWNGRRRMLEKWDKILRENGATDEHGNINLMAALPIFMRSKETAGLMAAIGDLASESRPFWATREAKRAEAADPHFSKTHLWEDAPGKPEFDQAEELARARQDLAQNLDKIQKGLKSGDILKSSGWRADPVLKEMQAVLTTMASDAHVAIPQLIMHKPSSHNDQALSPKPRAWTSCEGYVEINTAMRDEYTKNPGRWRVSAAHELAHHVNKDLTPHSIAQGYMVPYAERRSKEILAERMGALLHGNPREYAAQKAKLINHIESPHLYSPDHPSPNAIARMTRKWADILEREGVADKVTGQITDIMGAIDIYQRAKAMTDDFQKADRAIKGRA